MLEFVRFCLTWQRFQRLGNGHRFGILRIPDYRGHITRKNAAFFYG
jgi:hypothetical protein